MPDRSYKGGVIFVDHASGFVFVSPVVNFTAGEALRAKREFEAEMASMGVTIVNYHSDNGVFTSAQFQDELAKMGQDLTLSSVGAHHQNAVAEQAIGTFVSMTRTMMLQAKIAVAQCISTKLLPMAMKHAQHLLNHLPAENTVCPSDLVLETSVPLGPMESSRLGAPCFVLNPKLQICHKILKFEPRTRMALHVGLLPKHASTVPLVLNLLTGNISPQFHVVFNNWLTTVDSSKEFPDDSTDSAK